MARSRGAGTARLHAGGNVYDTGCQGGGDKKAGLAPTATAFMLGMPFAWRAALGGIATAGNGRANGGTRNFILSTVNQIGGVGRHRSATSIPSDGVNLNHINQGAHNCSISVHPISWQNVAIPPVIGGSFVGGLPQYGQAISETVTKDRSYWENQGLQYRLVFILINLGVTSSLNQSSFSDLLWNTYNNYGFQISNLQLIAEHITTSTSQSVTGATISPPLSDSTIQNNFKNAAINAGSVIDDFVRDFALAPSTFNDEFSTYITQNHPSFGTVSSSYSTFSGYATNTQTQSRTLILKVLTSADFPSKIPDGFTAESA